MNLAKFPRRGYVTEPTPLEFLPNFTKALGGKVNIYIKRDDILKEAAVLANNSTGDCGIEIEEVMFKRVFFPESNLVPIYNSMIAERQQVAETYRIEGQAEYDKIVSEANKYRAVEIAKAKGQAQKIVGDAEAESQRMIQSTMAKTAGLYELLKTYDVYLSSMDNIKMIFKPIVRHSKNFIAFKTGVFSF